MRKQLLFFALLFVVNGRLPSRFLSPRAESQIGEAAAIVLSKQHLPEPTWPIRESVELTTLEGAHSFTHHRLLEPIGYIPPAEAEANYYRQLASQVSTVDT